MSESISAMRLDIQPSIAPADWDWIDDQINRFNVAVTGYDDGLQLGIILRDEQQRIVAGLCGHTWGGCCEVKLLWIEESRRYQGLGSRMLKAAEDEARRRGCERMVLNTHSFQAPDFYKRHGFVETGAFDAYPRGYRQVFLMKRLVPPVA